jgi:hypothetical protein
MAGAADCAGMAPIAVSSPYCSHDSELLYRRVYREEGPTGAERRRCRLGELPQFGINDKLSRFRYPAHLKLRVETGTLHQ